ncbi:hypothetical protein AGR1B_Lc30087 [Agrobacterium fabacearum S56]|nr:hypothetical protein AGR1B_Lc30087 [Agrobacterium fabacearum S56]
MQRLVEILDGAARIAGAAVSRATNVIAFRILRIGVDDRGERGNVFLRALGTVDPEDIVSLVGRSAAGKTGEDGTDDKGNTESLVVFQEHPARGGIGVFHNTGINSGHSVGVPSQAGLKIILRPQTQRAAAN